MSFDLTLPPILGAVGLVIAFLIYTVMSRAPAGEGKITGIAEQIHIGAMVFMHREYK
jgi:K(+)-stimulated pyrophosphate-energized sodium pump